MLTNFKFVYRWPTYIWETETLTISFEWCGKEVSRSILIETEEIGSTFVRFTGINTNEMFHLKRTTNIFELRMTLYDNFLNRYEMYYMKKSLVSPYLNLYFDPIYKMTVEHGYSWEKTNDNS